MNQQDAGLPAWALSSEMMREYYLTEWGMPIFTEQGVFERLSLEAFQCGLSWATILAKRPAFRRAFHDFEVDAVAGMDDQDVARLMLDSGIIRNRRKLNATIKNARACQQLRAEGTDLGQFIWSFKPERTYAPRTLEEIPTRDETSERLSRDLKKRGFSFVGPTTCFALMEALGMHDTHVLSSPRRGSSGLWDIQGQPVK